MANAGQSIPGQLYGPANPYQSQPGYYNPISGNYNLPGQSNGTVQGASTTNYSSTGSSSNQSRNVSAMNPVQQTDYAHSMGYDNLQQMLDAQRSQAQGVSSQDVDNAYNEANSYYDQLYNNKVAGKQNYLDQYGQLYDSQRPGLDTAYQQGENLNQNQVGQVNQQANNALDLAKNLYAELTKGAQQRFGGSNSAGEFANAFMGKQFQQNVGQIQGTQGQNLQDLATQHQNLLSQYQSNVKELEAKKAQALTAAQNDFQNQLDAITGAKGQLAQDKASAKLSALQNYKATIQGIQDNANQFAQSLYSQHQAAADQLRNTIAGYQAYSGRPIDLSAIGNPQFAGIGQSQAFGPNYNVVGNMAGGKRYNPQTGQYE